MAFAFGAEVATPPENVPFMLTDDDILHDPGDMHDPLARECGPLEYLSRALARPDPRSDAFENAVVSRDAEPIEGDAKKPPKRRPKLFWNVERPCAAVRCSETTLPNARNDRRYPLCETHKRTPAVTCANGDVVCFCFYCYRAHGTDAFTTNTHTCDAQYYKRRTRILEKGKDMSQIKL